MILFHRLHNTAGRKQSGNDIPAMSSLTIMQVRAQEEMVNEYASAGAEKKSQ